MAKYYDLNIPGSEVQRRLDLASHNVLAFDGILDVPVTASDELITSAESYQILYAPNGGRGEMLMSIGGTYYRNFRLQSSGKTYLDSSWYNEDGQIRKDRLFLNGEARDIYAYAAGSFGKVERDGTDGQDGSDGITPHIDPTTKHWMIGDQDTGIVAEGQDGQDGIDGTDGQDGKSAYQIWLEQAGNAGKNMTQFLAWMKDTQAIRGPKYIEDESLIDTVNDRMTLFYVPSGTSYKVVFVDEGGGTHTLANRIGDITNYAGIYDVSADNEDNGVIPSYGTLSEAIADIPQAAQKGGMTIKYKDSDGKYHQYRYLLADTTDNDKFTDEDNWISENDVAESVSEHNDILANCYTEDTSVSKDRVAFFDSNNLIQANSSFIGDNHRLVLSKANLISTIGAYKVVMYVKPQALSGYAKRVSIASYNADRERISEISTSLETIDNQTISIGLDFRDFPQYDVAYISPYFVADTESHNITKDNVDPNYIDITFSYFENKRTLKAVSEEMLEDAKEELNERIDSINARFVTKSLVEDDISCYLSGRNNVGRAIFSIPFDGDVTVSVERISENSAVMYGIILQNINSNKEVNDIPSSDYKDISDEYEYEKADHQANVLTIMFKNSDDSEIACSDILDTYSIAIKKANNPTTNNLGQNDKPWKLYGLHLVREVISTGTPYIENHYTCSEYNTVPMRGMEIKIHLPIWLRVRFLCGVRTSRQYKPLSGYYFDEDVVTFNDNEPIVYVEFSRLDNRGFAPNALEKLLNEGDVQLTIVNCIDDRDIIQRNFDAEKYLGAIMATPDYAIGDALRKFPLIVHVSDVHGDAKRFNSAFDYADYINADILVNTGDNPFFDLADGVAFCEEIVRNHNTDYANCIGNHDQYGASGTTSQQIIDTIIGAYKDDYGYLLAPNTQSNKGYYYKDLDNAKLRIIALDIYDGFVYKGYSARISKTQIDWFIDTLGSTPEGFGVIVIMHQPPHGSQAIVGKENFNSVGMYDDQSSIDSSYMTGNNKHPITGNPIGLILDAFIGGKSANGSYTQVNLSNVNETIYWSCDFGGSNKNEGVEFIMYLNGHTHYDYCGYIKDVDEIQLNINVCSANGSRTYQETAISTKYDIYRGTKGVNQDAFNVYAIDRANGRVGIVRIGASVNCDLVERKVMWVDYKE